LTLSTLRACVDVLIPAAGRGERFGGQLPKQLTPICGQPLLRWTLRRFLDVGLTSITVAVPQELLIEAPARVLDDPKIRWVAGGCSRQESVEACLAATSGSEGALVLVHDGARPLLAVEDLRRVLEAAAQADGAVLGRTVSDTLKEVEAGTILRTVPRSRLFRAETPQVFRRRLLEQALKQSREEGFVGTDEASVVERMAGVKLLAVEARAPNPKLTVAADLSLIETLIQRSSDAETWAPTGGRER
jgi:2-C-methyl-D-erythritol 4-phosphate cytidylyltransferase